MNRYSYEELEAKAMRPDASQEDIENLADWFWHYGENYWNGEYFGIDETHVLVPIYEEVADGEFEIVRHEIR